ncbi:MAG: 4-hydroxy-tetrahydrodipicolinate reductase [Oscillospiraceae bacterium]|jgi:4-hydroxy-tetrahydrodipicolinate reductase|nr:4-hydroxy-tetrahydrodipicolinate reductase [Oscillospiraceae bacterium]
MNDRTEVKIAISGALGKMGGVIASLADGRADCVITAGVDTRASDDKPFPVHKSLFDMEADPDVVVDFSHSSQLDSLLSYGKTRNVPLVIATTGYSEAEITNIKAAANEIPVFFTFNMSLGINLLADLVTRAAAVLGETFDVEIIEQHHSLKKDSPSGTALMLAKAAENGLSYIPEYVYDRHNVRKPREQREIGFHAVRGGTIVGEHSVIFAGHDEIITLSHSARSKEVFAAGALSAAVFIAGKPPGLYTMKDLV